MKAAFAFALILPIIATALASPLDTKDLSKRRIFNYEPDLPIDDLTTRKGDKDEVANEASAMFKREDEDAVAMFKRDDDEEDAIAMFGRDNDEGDATAMFKRNNEKEAEAMFK
ncbi:hypothetical protein CPB84DRAFT_1809158 [Gymnopilus junonius]|uniref:Uncharacterized protein n=1 Tax=Gymnopilus junonius TaxID=109634 RepID=A0A9P5TEC2_GYMJU|nr:hypothetical protein CPB84DRAFT_1809158 [Gymnopilus junonius]